MPGSPSMLKATGTQGTRLFTENPIPVIAGNAASSTATEVAGAAENWQVQGQEEPENKEKMKRVLLFIYTWIAFFSSILLILFIIVPVFNKIKGIHTNFTLLASHGIKQALLFATVISLIAYLVHMRGR